MQYTFLGAIAGILLAIAAVLGGFTGFLLAIILGGFAAAGGAVLDGKLDLSAISRSRGRG